MVDFTKRHLTTVTKSTSEIRGDRLARERKKISTIVLALLVAGVLGMLAVMIIVPNKDEVQTRCQN